MKNLIILAAFFFTACATTNGRPHPMFAMYGDETGLIGERQLTYQFAYRVWQAGDIRDLQAFVSCELRSGEAKLREIATNEAEHMEKHRRQRNYVADDLYMSAMRRKRAGTTERLYTTHWLATSARLRTDEPCTSETKLLAQRFYENHMAGKYD